MALEALYEATGGDNWSNNEGWLVEDDISLWYGVTADSSGRVTGLQLGSNNLAGELPKELGGTSELSVDLTVLNLSNNQLGGSVPTGIAELDSLEELNLAQNQLSGAVPSELGDLSNLKRLYLDNNRFSGEFPTALGNLTSLEELSIWDNNLTWADSYANGYISDMVAIVAIHDFLLTHYSDWRESRGNYWLRYAPLDQWGDTFTVAGRRVVELNLSGYGEYAL